MTLLAVFIECAWKGTILLAAGVAASALLRRRSAALRHTVWVASLTAMLLLPLAVLRVPHWPVLGPHSTAAVPAYSPAVRVAVAAIPSAPAAVPLDLPLTIWTAGAGLAVLWFLAGIVGTFRMVRRAQPAGNADALAVSLGISRRVRLLSSHVTPMPLTWGILRPVVVLPCGAGEWPAARLRTVLLHELVHIRRFDLLAQAVGQAVCCLYWFHPLAWIAARQLRKEREQACDDAVLARGVPAPEYAGHLVDLVRGMAGRTAWTHSVAMAEGSGLEVRVRALLDPKRDRGPLNRRKALAIASAAAAILLPVAAMSQASRGSLVGVVRDPSGAVIPGCTVMLRQVDGSDQEIAKCNPAGQYHFDSIPPGSYSLEVRAAGFALYKAPSLQVTAGNVAQANANLETGSVSESVTVTGKRPPTVTPSVVAPQRIRVGGMVQPARLISQVRPEYPAELQQLGVEGTVILKAVISKDGVPLSLRPVSSSVDPRLVKLALDAVAQWRYTPMLLNGEPVETITSVDVAFTLNQ